MLTPVDDYPIVDALGRRDTFRGLPQTPPFNALAFALRSPTFRLRDLVRLNARAAAPLASVSVPDIYGDSTTSTRRHSCVTSTFPKRRGTWRSRCSPAASSPNPPHLSAAELATMFHIYFLGSSEGLIFDVANANFDVALWNPLRTYLESRGVRISHRSVGHRHQRTATEFGVACDDGTGIEADGVVLATDVAACAALSHNSPDLGDDDWRRRIDGLRTAPPFVVQRLWLDRRVNRDRAAFMGTGGRPPLDNVSVLERYERQAADWSAEVGGSVVELHAYAVTAPDGGLCDAPCRPSS